MKKVLVAVELSPEPARRVLEKAAAACQQDDRVEVVHVVDPSAVTYSVDPTMTGRIYEELYEETMAHARTRLVEICTPFGFTGQQLHVRYGRVAHEVHELLAEGSFDCLMLGSHGYSGWQLLLGSKASSILHGISVNTWVFSLQGLQPS